MLSEDQIVLHADDIVLVAGVSTVQEFEDFQLHARLILEFLLVSDDFDGAYLLVTMVEALDSLTEAAGADEVLNLVPVANVVADTGLQLAVGVIIAIVIDIHQR